MVAGLAHRWWLPLLLLSPSWLALAWLVSKAQWFWNHRPDLQFGWIVLLLSGYLIWDSWERKPTLRLRLTLGVVALATTGLVLVFVFQIYQSAFGMMPAALLALALGVMLLCASNLLYVFGWRGVNHFFVAFGFLLIALPLPSAIYNPIVSGLQHYVAAVNVEILKLLGIPAQRIGSLIHLPNGVVGVDEACSGIRSLQSTLMATIFIGHLTLQKVGSKVFLIAFGVMLALVGNLIRSFMLSYTASSRGIESIQSLHDSAGWSILAFTGAGVILIAWAFSQVERVIEKHKPQIPSEGSDGFHVTPALK